MTELGSIGRRRAGAIARRRFGGQRRWVISGLLLSVLASSSARAVPKSWIGPNNGSWNNNGNWNPNGRPTAADDVTINFAGTVRLNNNPSGVALSLTLANGATLTRTGARTLTVTNALTLSTGNATVSVPLTAGSVAMSSSGTLTLNSAGGTATSIGGAVNVSAGTLALGANLSGGSVSVSSGAGLTVNFSAATTVTTVTVSGNATVSGVLNVTKNGGVTITPGTYNIVTSTGGTLDTTGISLGATASGNGFALKTTGNTLQLEVYVQAVQVDSVASTTGTCASNLTWQHTVGANTFDRYLVVGISTGFAGATTGPNTVTYGTQGMTQLASDNAGTTRVFLYGLVAPAQGTNTITVTWNAGSCNAVAGSVSYTGVNQTTPVGTAAVGVDSPAGLATVNVTTVQGDKVFSVLSSNAAATSATPVQSSAIVRWSALNSTELGAADTFNVTSPGTTTMSWTLTPNTAALWSLAAVPIHASTPSRAGDGVPEVHTSSSGAAVSWRLQPDSDIVGFRVWRDSAGERQLVTPDLVAGPVLSGQSALRAGSEVGWLDQHAPFGAQYWLEALHVDGSTEWVRAMPGSGKAPAFASVVLGQPASVIRAQPAVRVSTAEPLPPRPSAFLGDVQWQLAAGKTVKITVSRPGVVRVPAEWLFDAGLPVGTPASSLRLFRQSREVLRWVDAADGATLRAGDALEFYGEGMDTRYSGSAVYWLSIGPGLGRAPSTQPAASTDASVATFLARAEIRERLVWAGTIRNGDAEKFFGPAVFSQPLYRTFSLPGLDVAAAGARLEVALGGVTQIPHAVNLAVNGIAVGTLAFDGQTVGAASIALPPGALVAGDNVVQLVAPGASDFSLVQYIRIVYPRMTVRGSGPLELTLPAGATARLDGFDPGLTRVLDITDRDAPVRLSTWDAAGAAAVAAPGTGVRRLLAYLPGDVSAPDVATANRSSSWHSAEGADLVIIGPSLLLPGVQPLVDRRTSEGLRVALVDVEDVQDEFASGEKSADALRAFLTQALQSWAIPPRWVLLLGSASYDPRNYLGFGGDLVPSGTVQTDLLEAASDSWFLAVPGAEAVSIGRLPVRDLGQTAAVVAKILGRREADARSPLLLVSDSRDTSDFPEMTAALRADFAQTNATVLTRGTQPDDVLHQQLVDAARGGPALVNYTGHAAETFWRGNIHSVDDLPALAGGGTSLWVDMTCQTATFQDPLRQSLAVATLLAPSGGAWGTWGSTSRTYPTDHPALDRALVKALLVDGMTLGEATRAALAGLSDVDLQSTFVLLGDPSARAVAQKSSALTTSTRSSSALGCSTSGTGAASAAVLLLVGLWLTVSRRRAVVRVTGRR
jgi:uncharacterized protein (TIGR03382 family)